MEHDQRNFPDDRKKTIFQWGQMADGDMIESGFRWFFTQQDALNDCPRSIVSENIVLLTEEYIIPNWEHLLAYCFKFLKDREIVTKVGTNCRGCRYKTTANVTYSERSAHLQGCQMPNYQERIRYDMEPVTPEFIEGVKKLYKEIRNKLFSIANTEIDTEFDVKMFYIREGADLANDIPYIFYMLLDGLQNAMDGTFLVRETTRIQSNISVPFGMISSQDDEDLTTMEQIDHSYREK